MEVLELVTTLCGLLLSSVGTVQPFLGEPAEPQGGATTHPREYLPLNQ